MKQKRINRLIEESGVLGFEFDNDDAMFTWLVTPAEGKMLAKRIIECDSGGFWEDFAAIPYDDLDACESLYYEVVFDFVECFGDDLSFGTAGSLGLFSDIASKGDDGLIELLSFFGKTYDEFLLDVFFYYSCWLEMQMMLEECDIEVYYDEKAAADESLVKSVLRHLCDTSLFVEPEEGSGVYWEFAVARGEIWYHRMDMEFDDDLMFYTDEFGHAPLDDHDAFAALQDAVLTSFGDAHWAYEQEGDALGMIGLKLEDLVD